jgi:hypothetical protein
VPPAGWIVRPIILLDPDAAQDIHRGLGPHLRGCFRRVDSLEKGESIGADRCGQPLPFGFRLGEPIVFDTRPIALKPYWLQVGLLPHRGHGCQAVQRETQGFADQFKTVERPDGRQDMG